MNYTFETQGAITYLVCELDTTDRIDTLTHGMLANNHIAGLAPMLYTEMNGQRYFKYNISAKVSSDLFFSSNMTKQRLLTVFKNILNAVCTADEYMIDQNCFSLAPEHIFLNVSSCETALICIPVTTDRDVNYEVIALVRKIIGSVQLDSSEDASYITRLISYINNVSQFSIYGLRDMVCDLLSGKMNTQQTPVFAQNAQQSEAGANHPVAPVSSFDSTISIEDVPSLMNQTPVQEQNPVNQSLPKNNNVSVPASPVAVSAPSNFSNIPSTPSAPVIPNIPAKPQNPVVEAEKPIVQSGRPISSNINPVNNTMGGSAQKFGQVKPNVQKPVTPNAPAFAIPGQQSSAVQKPAKPQPVVPAKAKKTEDKKMSLFGLLAHYNKDNVELYKKQKEEAKKAKANATKSSKKATPVAKPEQPAVTPTTQPPVQPVYYPPVQPVPVQNSFNETTVLGPAFGGETTILNESPISGPYLTRVKTGDKISVNKPVFRIGKEKSYVDYFIGDNTAISRSHANIHTDNGEYYIEDTNSTNHTYVNGTLINSNVKVKLTNGDKVRLANEDFTFSI